MKEASGEANLTVVTIILIGVIVAVVTPIVSGLMNTTKERACCLNQGGHWEGGKCSISIDESQCEGDADAGA